MTLTAALGSRGAVQRSAADARYFDGLSRRSPAHVSKRMLFQHATIGTSNPTSECIQEQFFFVIFL